MADLTLSAHCHCTSTTITFDIPRAALPLPITLCHCTYCRTSHGTLASFLSTLPEGITPKITSTNLRTYVPRNGHLGVKVRKLFCGRCGCPVAEEEVESKRWRVVSAIFERECEDENGAKVKVWEYKRHVAPGSVAMGGLFRLLGSVIDGVQLDVEDVVDPDAVPPEETDNTMRASCHCAGVSFTFARPNDAARSDSIANCFISPTDPSKWVCGLDHCDDCRLVTGANVMPWSFTLIELISPAVEREEMRVGSSRMYASSEGTKRTFCYECGATVFFWRAARLETVDVPVGLMRGVDALVTRWVAWWPELVHAEDGRRFDGGFVRALEERYKEFLEVCGAAEK